jgi:hypothetical protein
MGVSFTKRLIGKQDIAWDENGTGNERTYENPNTGAEYPVTDINAGDIPLTASTRTAIGGGVKDVDAALAA